ncbi:MAG TPA: 16S rRNA (guanine(527)-N(7))-methyltransferase RsmG [Candidatus Binataceae bacterium]|nr:16S rRNA (guanine(527)-N(7))-methyltransferase RsmG [Candidatus Binataceae bacterium]
MGLFLQKHADLTPPAFLNRIEILARNLATWGVRMNLTARPEDPEEIAFHIIDSLMPIVLATEVDALRSVFHPDSEVLDLGSGAGFPGLVLASGCDAHFTLVESRRKRASFLQIATAEMELRNVAIETRRAEEIDLVSRFDVVTARAFGDPSVFFALAASALKPAGLAILYANPSQHFNVEVERIPYDLERDGRRVDRVLAIRQKR